MMKTRRAISAWWRSVFAALYRLRWPLGVLVTIMALSTLLFWLGGVQRTPVRAFVYTVNLITLQVNPDALPAHPAYELAAIAVMAGGLLTLAGGAANVIEYARDPRLQQMSLAATFSHHVVVCGVGRVGYRVITELIELGDSVVAVNQTEREEWLEALRRLGVPVIIGDARQRATLLEAGVDRASSIVACTSDDLTNLDVALDARELRPDIKVVLRMFDQRLAEKISRGFNIKTAFSVSALAAPALAAAATRARVDYSFKLDGRLLNVVSVRFESNTPFTGGTIKALEEGSGCSVIGLDGPDGMRMNPAHDHVVKAGDRLHIVGPLDGVRQFGDGARTIT
jgi:voltage-gated potassium channel